MAEKDILFKQKIRHTGIFDFKEMYRILYEWLIDQGYDVNEKQYKEVIGAGNAREIEVEWEGGDDVFAKWVRGIPAHYFILKALMRFQTELSQIGGKINGRLSKRG